MPPIVIAAGVAGAASLGGAAMASNAAKKASSQQMAAGQQALAYEREMLGKQEAAAKPYMQLGQQSVGMLGGGKAFAPPNLNPYGPQPGVANQAGGYSSVPIPKTSASTSPGAYTMGQLGQTAQTGTDEMVTVRAPNGQTRQMPRSMAQQFVAKGATIV